MSQIVATRFALLALVATLATHPMLNAQDSNERTEAAVKQVVQDAQKSIVKIETLGGAEVVGAGNQQVRIGRGPTTGVIVSADGYIITSAFNFANRPTDLFVTMPGTTDRVVAKQIATDQSRMLTLIKIDKKDLPVLKPIPVDEINVGDWSIALGRSLSSGVELSPSVSLGIISAKGRISGKALQTDAKISPVNYGGPILSVDGRVQGILVPASPQGEGDTAGVEWYDSGIGFAIPFADVLRAAERLKSGKDLNRGLLGITSASTELYNPEILIGTVAADSPAAKAGIKPNDRLIKIDGRMVKHYTDLLHILGPKYEGDKVDLELVREGVTIKAPGVVLAGEISAISRPFFGILPMRDDPNPGVAVRFIYDGGPAANAGIKVGDRITKLTPPTPPKTTVKPKSINLKDRFQFATLIQKLPIDSECQVELKRADGGKVETVTVKLALMTEAIPPAVPLPSTYGKAPLPGGAAAPMDDKPAADTKAPELKLGLQQKKNSTVGREYWLYVPETYQPTITHGVIVWLHPSRRGGKDVEEMLKIWRPFLEDFHYIMMGPKSQAADGWLASESEGVAQDIREVVGQYTVDRSRVIAHGMGNGGQMAFYLGFHARDLVRGVATTGAALGTLPKENIPNQPLGFFIVGGEKDPSITTIAGSIPALKKKQFPVIYRQLKDFGKEYMLQSTLLELCVWIDSIDKI